MRGLNAADRLRGLIGIVCVLTLTLVSCASYMKMDPPADVEKGPPAPTAPCNPGDAIIDNSCWMATASNMLAGAGYGTGGTIQARADDIYADMVANYGKQCGGWTDAALSWWLNSANNTWTTNPYRVVTVYGNKSPRFPWANAQGARDIGNELRACNFVGLSISWPTDAAGAIGSGGHAITAWGDNSGDNTLTANPGGNRLTDSDNDAGGNLQAYTYDAYTNPNPGGANEGNGWYFNYDNNHPYIKHIVVLSPTQNPSGGVATQKVVGSYRIHQTRETAATDLHYRVGTDVEILSYKTKQDWDAPPSPKITEASPRRSIMVRWDLEKTPVPYCTWVTITTEFILPSWNAMRYDSVYFTYPRGVFGKLWPEIRWELQTPKVERAETIRNVTGGYVVGAFAIRDQALTGDSAVVGEYRFIHEYGYDQNPELHTLLLSGQSGYSISRLRIGHSYGFLPDTLLWNFDQWMTDYRSEEFRLGEQPLSMSIDWKGKLPYPEGEDIKGRIPELKPGQQREPEGARIESPPARIVL
jgi:hypothetical protein